MARYFSDYNLDLNKFRTLIIPIIVVIVPTAIVIKQSDLGSSIIILSSLIPMIYWSRVNPYFIFLLIGPIISLLTAFHNVSFTIWGISMIGILYVVCPNLIRGVITYFSFLLFGLFSPWFWGAVLYKIKMAEKKLKNLNWIMPAKEKQKHEIFTTF